MPLVYIKQRILNIRQMLQGISNIGRNLRPVRIMFGSLRARLWVNLYVGARNEFAPGTCVLHFDLHFYSAFPGLTICTIGLKIYMHILKMYKNKTTKRYF